MDRLEMGLAKDNEDDDVEKSLIVDGVRRSTGCNRLSTDVDGVQALCCVVTNLGGGGRGTGGRSSRRTEGAGARCAT